MTGSQLLDATSYDIEASLLRLRNFRDLGGLPTRTCDVVVRPLRFFRSSAPSHFAPAEQRALATLNFRSVIDLRTTVEVGQSASAVFVPGAQVAHLPLFEVARRNWIAPADQSPQATAVRYFEMLDDSRHAIAAVVLQIARPDTTPVLVFCSAGRDRTGIVVACLLDLLNVTDEAIATDYAHSDAFDRSGGRAHAMTLFEWLGLVRARYGSVQRMLASFGITDDIVDTLCRELLVRRD